MDLSRTEKLLGKSNIEKLNNSGVAVFGLGGVGSYVFEALVRSGVGKILVCDGDVVAPSNINRQILALNSTIGQNKANLACARGKDISDIASITVKPIFYNAETEGEFDLSSYDYIADCIDTVTSKLLLIERAVKEHKQIISCMGTGNKLMSEPFEVCDIYSTQECPLAKVMRRELKKRGIERLKVVYSKEPPRIKERTPASISFAPATAGLLIAREIIMDIIK